LDPAGGLTSVSTIVAAVDTASNAINRRRLRDTGR
jgi:hypothetical protein